MRPAGRRRRQISVLGATHPEPEVEMKALEIGRLIARAGCVLVCGGYEGVMEAAARGASEEDGTVVGILMGYDADEGNPFLDIAIPTGMGYGRNVMVAASGDGVIAVGGASGTLSEIAYAIKLGKPIALVDSWDFSSRNGAGDSGDERIKRTGDPAGAVDYILERLGWK